MGLRRSPPTETATSHRRLAVAAGIARVLYLAPDRMVLPLLPESKAWAVTLMSDRSRLSKTAAAALGENGGTEGRSLD